MQFKPFLFIFYLAIGFSFAFINPQGFLAGQAAPSGGPQTWAAYYDGPAGLEDVPNGLAVDSEGNVYVTGTSKGDAANPSQYMTVKYKPDGKRAWVKTYNGPIAGPDEAHAIAVDTQGDIYVTGGSTSMTEYDFLTIKYSPAGEIIWQKRYNAPGDRPGSQLDIAQVLVLDNAHVYVAGQSMSTSGTEEIAVVKYASTDGGKLWEGRFPGQTARAIAVDLAGNVFVAAVIYKDQTEDFEVVKFSQDGAQLWLKSFAGPGYQDDIPFTLVVDDTGNIYVTGESERVVTGEVYTDQVTIKYAPDGTKLWTRRDKGPLKNGVTPAGMHLSPDGNLLLAGHTWVGQEGHNYQLQKIDPEGNLIWERFFGGTREEGGWAWARALAVDMDGNSYVTGFSYGQNNSREMQTIKYDSQGEAQWIIVYKVPFFDPTQDLFTFADHEGNLLVSGEFEDDYLTVKFPASPGPAITIEDVSLMEGNVTAEFSVHLSVAVGYEVLVRYATTDGSATAGSDYTAQSGLLRFVPGQTHARISVPILGDETREEDEAFSVQLTIPVNAKLSDSQAQGTIRDDDMDFQVWARRYDSPLNGKETQVGLGVDKYGNVFVTGDSYSKPDSTMVTLKYEPDGNVVWTNTVPGRPNDLALTPYGVAYIVGSVDYQAVKVTKLSSDGNLVWERYYDSPSIEGCSGTAIALDNSGNVYVTGWCVTFLEGGDKITDLVTLKFSKDGILLWVKSFDGEAHLRDSGLKIRVDSAGNVYVIGYTQNSIGGQAFVVIKYNPNGEIVWQKTYYYLGITDRDNQPSDLQIDALGNVYVSGHSVYTTTTTTETMALILKYSADGDLLWEYARVGSAWAIAIDHSGNVYWTGNSGYPTDKFYTSQLTPNGQYVWGENFVHGSGNAIALDRQNNVYVTGGARASSGGGEIATLAYAADGTILWSQRYDYGRDYDSGKDLVVDEAGYVYVSGDSMYDFATIKYESLLRPYITIPDALGIEGESGTQPLEVHVELSAVLPTDSTVKYTTTSGTAKAGQDFQSASGTLTIPANKDWVAIPIQILSDTQKEGSETFQVILSDPTGADLVDSEAVVTIWDAGSVLRFMPLSISVK